MLTFKGVVPSAFIIFILVMLSGAIASKAHSSCNPTSVIVGAIRWDGWVGAPNSVGEGAQAALGPNQFHYRVPWYGTEVGSNTVTAYCTSQACEDQEIAYAKYVGLNYWAFDWYPSSSGLQEALDLYLSSTHTNDVNFSLIVDPDYIWTYNYATPTQLAAYFAMGNYQTVMGNRPLLYFLGDYLNNNSVALTLAQVTAVRNAATAAGAANPYIVDMQATGSDVTTAAACGLDAISWYACHWITPSFAEGAGAPYADLAATDIAQWSYEQSQYNNMVPNVTTGWDNRPFHLNPTSWYADPGPNNWFQEATPSQIVTHVQDALTWVANNLSAAAANTVIIYAWNEFAEGGWISPTLTNYEGAERLDAMASLLTGCSATPTPVPSATPSPCGACTATPSPPACNPSLIDNLDSGGTQNQYGGYWYTYTGMGSSLISPEPFSDSMPGYGGMGGYAQVSGTADVIDGAPILGTSLVNLAYVPTGTNASAYGGVSFWFQGDGNKYEVFIHSLVEGSNNNDYEYTFTPPVGWSLINVLWSSFTFPGWGPTYSMDTTELSNIYWMPVNSGSFAFGVDVIQFSCLAQGTATPTPTPSSTPTITLSLTSSETVTPSRSVSPFFAQSQTLTPSPSFTRTPAKNVSSPSGSGGSVVSCSPALNPQAGPSFRFAVQLSAASPGVRLSIYSEGMTAIADSVISGSWRTGWNTVSITVPGLANGLYFVLVRTVDEVSFRRKPVLLMVIH